MTYQQFSYKSRTGLGPMDRDAVYKYYQNQYNSINMFGMGPAFNNWINIWRLTQSPTGDEEKQGQGGDPRHPPKN